MSVVQSILESNRHTVEVRGVQFVLRRPGAMAVLKAVGAGALEMSAPETPRASTPRDDQSGRQAEIAEALLRLTLVSPRIADKTDPEADTITIDDLGPFADGLLAEIDKLIGGDAEGFQSSSPDERGAPSR